MIGPKDKGQSFFKMSIYVYDWDKKKNLYLGYFLSIWKMSIMDQCPHSQEQIFSKENQKSINICLIFILYPLIWSQSL